MLKPCRAAIRATSQLLRRADSSEEPPGSHRARCPTVAARSDTARGHRRARWNQLAAVTHGAHRARRGPRRHGPIPAAGGGTRGTRNAGQERAALQKSKLRPKCEQKAFHAKVNSERASSSRRCKKKSLSGRGSALATRGTLEGFSRRYCCACKAKNDAALRVMAPGLDSHPPELARAPAQPQPSRERSARRRAQEWEGAEGTR
ncbi:unnamed protein product [Lampetra planeri]